MYSRQREACFSSGRHATNLAETTDGVGWLDYLLFRLGVAIGMRHTTHTLIKIVQGRGSGRTKAQPPNHSCLWQERVHFRSRQEYINKEISLENFFLFFCLWISAKSQVYVCWSVLSYIFRLGQEADLLRINIHCCFQTQSWEDC